MDIKETLKIFSFLPAVHAVGGCVRDWLMDIPYHDIDLATAAKPEEVISLCTEHDIGTVNTGIKSGTITAYVDGIGYEITTFRSDHNQDGRHADVNYVSTIEEDLARRDFTINAIAIDTDGNVIDPYGGVNDIAFFKRIRAVRDPIQRFREDYLRTLRAARFAARFGFRIDPRTLNAMTCLSWRIQKFVSPERVKMEFDKAFQDSHPDKFIDILFKTRILQQIFPEYSTADRLTHNHEYHPEGPLLEHIKVVVCRAVPECRWEAFLHDIGKTITFNQSVNGEYYNYYDHAEIGEVLVNDIADRLKFSNILRASCVAATKYHMMPAMIMNADCKHERAIRRFQNIAGEYLDMLHRLCYADLIDRKSYDKELFDKIFTPLQPKPKPIVSGKQILARGYKPGPEIGKIQRICQQYYIETGIDDPGILLDAVISGNLN